MFSQSYLCYANVSNLSFSIPTSKCVRTFPALIATNKNANLVPRLLQPTQICLLPIATNRPSYSSTLYITENTFNQSGPDAIQSLISLFRALPKIKPSPPASCARTYTHFRAHFVCQRPIFIHSHSQLKHSKHSHLHAGIHATSVLSEDCTVAQCFTLHHLSYNLLNMATFYATHKSPNSRCTIPQWM